MPRGAYRLVPDEEYYEISYSAWCARVGQLATAVLLAGAAWCALVMHRVVV